MHERDHGRVGRAGLAQPGVYFIPNGTISTVVNMSRRFAHAVVDIGVGYDADLDQVMGIMREVGAQMRREAEFAPRNIDDLEIAGVQDWGDSAVKIRARLRVVALSQWAVRRAYLLRLKRAFDAHGIEIPFPQLTVHHSGVAQPALGRVPDGAGMLGSSTAAVDSDAGRS